MQNLPAALRRHIYYKRGKELFSENLRVISLLLDLCETALGPRGRSKIIFDKESGDYKVTKSGVLILKEAGPVHPAAKILAETGIASGNETGDGSLSTVVFAGKLLEKAQKLREQGFHPSVIVRGFELASSIALEFLKEISHKIDPGNREGLLKLAETCIATKLDLEDARFLSEITVRALESVISLSDEKFDIEMFKVEGREGASVRDSKLVEGVVVHKFAVDRTMPRRIERAKVAILECALEIEKPKTSTQVILRNPSDVSQFYRERDKIIIDMVEGIARSGANVVLCTKNIDEEVRRLLAARGIFAIRNIQPKDLYNLKIALKATPVHDPMELRPEHLGECELVEERILTALDRWTFFERCKDPRVRSILIRGSTESIVEEAKNAVRNALKILYRALRGWGVIPGGGASEFYLAWRLREKALRLPRKEQVILQAFADALEDLGITPAKNAGMDPIDVKLQLRHGVANGDIVGVDAFRREIADTWSRGILEASHVKAQVIKSAVDAAKIILRVDFAVIQPPKPPEKKSPIPEPVRKAREATERAMKYLDRFPPKRE